MKAIDLDKTNFTFVQKSSSQPKAIVGKHSAIGDVSNINNKNQISDFLSLVHNSNITINNDNHMSQLKEKINADNYEIDLTILTDNICAEIL